MVLSLSEDGYTRVRLQSGDGKNFLAAPDITRLEEALAAAPGNVLLLEATGPFFCSGAEFCPALQKLFSANFWRQRPVVAAVQGPALAAGVAMMAACHLVIAAQGASFAFPEIRGGGWPEAGWQVLCQALGVRRLRALTLSGRVFSVQEALQWGLVHEVAPAFELDDRATATAAHLASLEPAALRNILQAPTGH